MVLSALRTNANIVTCAYTPITLVRWKCSFTFNILVICKKTVDIVMVADESGSIGQGNFKLIKEFLANVVTRFSVSSFGTHFGLLKFSTSPTKVFDLGAYTNTQKLQAAIRGMTYGRGGTKTGKAFKYARENVCWYTACYNLHQSLKIRLPWCLVERATCMQQQNSKTVKGNFWYFKHWSL